MGRMMLHPEATPTASERRRRTGGRALAALCLMLAAPAVAQEGADVDPLAELAALGDAMADAGPEGGGSIRAKRNVDPEEAQRRKDKRNIEARVEQLNTGKFPAVAVKLKVLKPAKEGEGKDIKRSQTLVVVPALKIEGSSVAMEDPQTRLNAGAFYLQVGDQVLVRLGAQKGNVWTAEYIERK